MEPLNIFLKVIRFERNWTQIIKPVPPY